MLMPNKASTNSTIKIVGRNREYIVIDGLGHSKYLLFFVCESFIFLTLWYMFDYFRRYNFTVQR